MFGYLDSKVCDIMTTITCQSALLKLLWIDHLAGLGSDIRRSISSEGWSESSSNLRTHTHTHTQKTVNFTMPTIHQLWDVYDCWCKNFTFDIFHCFLIFYTLNNLDAFKLMSSSENLKKDVDAALELIQYPYIGLILLQDHMTQELWLRDG